MPYIANTPEALVTRSDSKNPNTTCAGLACSGRKCRRAISANPTEKGDVALYCWQHKDQAGHIASPSLCKTQPNSSLAARTSIDTIAERLGLLNIEKVKKRQTEQKHPTLLEKQKVHKQEPNFSQRQPNRSSGLFSSLCCCFTSFDNDPFPRPSRLTRPPTHRSSVPPRPSLRESAPAYTANHSYPTRTRTSEEHFKLIPSVASTDLASRLLAELAKPISSSDGPGYIYMFWLTPSEAGTPPERVATDLMFAPVSSTKASQTITTAEAYQNFLSTSKSNTCKEKSFMLKIGRANNVTRRMQEWKRQCGYDLTLLRYYPYLDETAGGGTEALKTPWAHKVERLIHLELSSMQMNRGKCEACQREHREWFEVGVNREAIRAVDSVIRKWVNWSLNKVDP